MDVSLGYNHSFKDGYKMIRTKRLMLFVRRLFVDWTTVASSGKCIHYQQAFNFPM